jgi:HEAT repeat protein
MKSTILKTFFATVLGAAFCPCQIRALDGVPAPDSRVLDEYHIPRTKDALAAALNHPVSSVRGQAALALAAQREKSSVPPILAALAGETSPGTRMDLAAALAILGAEDGIVALGNMCTDQSWPPGLRMSAAGRMLSLHHDECFSSVLDVLRLHDDDQATLQALSFVGRFEHVTTQQLAQIRSLVPVSLRSQNVTVRAFASQVLPQFGDYSSLYLLQGALAAEQDASARQAMATAVRLLAAKLEAKQ